MTNSSVVFLERQLRGAERALDRILVRGDRAGVAEARQRVLTASAALGASPPQTLADAAAILRAVALGVDDTDGLGAVTLAARIRVVRLQLTRGRMSVRHLIEL
jgi:hypothetical protein